MSSETIGGFSDTGGNTGGLAGSGGFSPAFCEYTTAPSMAAFEGAVRLPLLLVPPAPPAGGASDALTMLFIGGMVLDFAGAAGAGFSSGTSSVLPEGAGTLSSAGINSFEELLCFAVTPARLPFFLPKSGREGEKSPFASAAPADAMAGTEPGSTPDDAGAAPKIRGGSSTSLSSGAPPVARLLSSAGGAGLGAGATVVVVVVVVVVLAVGLSTVETMGADGCDGLSSGAGIKTSSFSTGLDGVVEASGTGFAAGGGGSCSCGTEAATGACGAGMGCVSVWRIAPIKSPVVTGAEEVVFFFAVLAVDFVG
jgi:hypothetical protein